MMPSSGQTSVPPGFRFHPTDEELLYYYLRKKVSYEAIDLDVIREVDLNKLEPWDLKDKCKIGSGPQNEWYFFSHKDKKYPTGTRTNRATTAGFWKATGRDKAIHLSNAKRIGMRKTLVFYTGRAPHGQKTDWIMHEYRLEDDATEVQEDGWVVCRVFKKKHHRSSFQPTGTAAGDHQEEDQEDDNTPPLNHNHTFMASSSTAMMKSPPSLGPMKQSFHHNILYPSTHNPAYYDGHLPQLFSPEALVPAMGSTDCGDELLEGSHNLLRLMASNSANNNTQERATAPSFSTNGSSLYGPSSSLSDWSFLDKLLASGHVQPPPPTSLFPFQYLGCDSSVELFKFDK